MKLNSALGAAILAPALAAATHAAAQVFPLPAYSTFQNDRWGGLVLNETTAKTLKTLYTTEAQTDIPRSVQLSGTAASGARVNVLFSGPGDSADPMHAVLTRYDTPLQASDLEQDLGGPGTVYYPPERQSDWALEAFPTRGIVAFLQNAGSKPTVSAVLLQPKDALISEFQGLQTAASPVKPAVDPNANVPRVIAIGDVAVSTNLVGIELSDQEQTNLEEELRESNSQGAVNFASGAPGRYTVYIAGRYDSDKGGRIDMALTIAGSTPYGPVHVSGTASQDLKQGMVPVDSAVYSLMARQARHAVEKNLVDALSKLSIPSPDTVRRQAWGQLLQQFRMAASNALGKSGDVPTEPGF